MSRTRLFPAAALCLGLITATSMWAQVHGAIFTTDSTGTRVNANIYQNAKDVYLNGGPQNQNDPGLYPDGTYYFQVTDPPGKVLLSTDKVTCRQVIVQNGRIIGVPSLFGTPPPNGKPKGCDHNLGTFNPANGQTP